MPGRWSGARPCSRDRGSCAVELAITMPAILIALFAGIQAAALFVARSAALGAAEQATTAERAYNAPPGVGHARAETFLNQTGDWLTDRKVTIIRGDTEVTTVVEGQALSLIPGVTFTVTQRSHGAIERFTTQEQP
ncbi:MAG: pilus assembly protein [Dactylosporangium sp.]|nr:pilus assembly protein [Dactylosporangium sp.]NNJ63499.1 pilus assembly protein [Dactylosporangium sp.]